MKFQVLPRSLCSQAAPLLAIYSTPRYFSSTGIIMATSYSAETHKAQPLGFLGPNIAQNITKITSTPQYPSCILDRHPSAPVTFYSLTAFPSSKPVAAFSGSSADILAAHHPPQIIKAPNLQTIHRLKCVCCYSANSSAYRLNLESRFGSGESNKTE